MEAKVIIISVVKSNKSENNVWMVAITGEEQGKAYCKSPYKAMKSIRIWSGRDIKRKRTSRLAVSDFWVI